ncbi:MAG: hypothetical protein ABEJ98_01945 [Candidatus Nanohaloarchaea archaeon]
MKKSAVLLLAVLLVSGATGFTASMHAVDRSASLDDPAMFKVVAENELARPQRFRITSVNSPPSTDGWFDYTYSKTAEAGENVSFEIQVFPAKYSIQQNYRFTVNVAGSQSDSQARFQDYFSVNTGNELNIFSVSMMNDTYLPGEKAEVKVELVNTASSYVRNYTVRAAAMGKSTQIDGEIIPSGASRSFSFSFEIPENARPGRRNVDVTVLKDSSVTVSRVFRVQRVSEISRNSTSESYVVSKTKTVTVENTGNAPENTSITYRVESYLTPLTSFSARPSSVSSDNGEKVYRWTRTLSPGEEFSVTRKVDYWPPVAVLALIVLGLAGVKKLYTGVKIEKHAKTVDEGVKVRIEAINRSRQDAEEVEIIDFVPDIASVSRDFPMAAPEVAKTGEGTRLTWSIGRMDAGEQRVMEYVLKPGVKVEGGVTLPAAELKVEGEKLGETSRVTADFDPSNHS